VTAAPQGTRQTVAAPRAAAVAGVIFAVLMILSLVLMRLAAPADPAEPVGWLTGPGRRYALRVALHMVPFAGVAFLWFVGVIRSRLGAQEDQFLATVVLGSGLLFIACLFGAAALTGGLSDAIDAGHVQLRHSETYDFAIRTGNVLLNVFAIKMAGVFMFSTCTIGLRTAILPRWVAFVGYACGLVLLLVITDWEWIALLFPLWVLLVSIVTLTAEFGRQRGAAERGEPAANQEIRKAAPEPGRAAQGQKEEG